MDERSCAISFQAVNPLTAPVHPPERVTGPPELHHSEGRYPFHAFNFDKYARRYLGGYCFRFNRRFSLAAMTERIANAVCCCRPCTERDLRVAEAYG